MDAEARVGMLEHEGRGGEEGGGVLGRLDVYLSAWPCDEEERIFIEGMTSDCELQASREGSK